MENSRSFNFFLNVLVLIEDMLECRGVRDYTIGLHG